MPDVLSSSQPFETCIRRHLIYIYLYLGYNLWSVYHIKHRESSHRVLRRLLCRLYLFILFLSTCVISSGKGHPHQNVRVVRIWRFAYPPCASHSSSYGVFDFDQSISCSVGCPPPRECWVVELVVLNRFLPRISWQYPPFRPITGN